MYEFREGTCEGSYLEMKVELAEFEERQVNDLERTRPSISSIHPTFSFHVGQLTTFVTGFNGY
jgi:hypothetical protein